METKQHIYQTGGLVLDDEQKRITVDGEAIYLTPVQYKILRFLIANAGKVYSIDEIYEKVWNEPSFHPENTVAVHIRKIREKSEINPKELEYLKVVWGMGYKDEKISSFHVSKNNCVYTDDCLCGRCNSYGNEYI